MNKLKIITGIIVSLISSCSIQLNTPNEIVNIQDDIRQKILNNETFCTQKAINQLENQFLIDYTINGINPISTNNIAVRNYILLSVLYYINGNQEKYNKTYQHFIYLLKYNLIEKGVWNEGPSYYLYVEEMIEIYEKIVDNKNEFLIMFKKDSRKWIAKYITPDGLLPPIGETRRDKYNDANYNNINETIFDSNQTLIKKDNLYVFFRHPTTKMYKYQINGHIHYDLGNLVVYKGEKCIVYPVGYNGYKQKQESNLSDLKNENSLYLDTLNDPLWRLFKYELINVNRGLNNVSANYKIFEKEINRKIDINVNQIMITDNGSDGINLNVSNDCEIIVYIGAKIEEHKGNHVEENKIIQNRRVFIRADNKITMIGIIIK